MLNQSVFINTIDVFLIQDLYIDMICIIFPLIYFGANLISKVYVYL